MAVRKLKAKKIIDFALPLMQRELISPYVITTVGGENFKGAKGDTVNMRVRGLKAVARDYDFRGRTGPIVLDDITPDGGNVSIKLNTHIVSATGLEDEHFTLDDIDFATEVLKPQTEAVRDRIENKVVAAFRAGNFKHTLALSVDDDPHLVSIEARRLMDSDKVAPSAGRVHLIGTDVAAAWLASDRLSTYHSTGQEGSPALREAIIGTLGGSPVVVHNGLNPAEGYYLSRGSFVLATVAPSIPRGAVTGQSLSSGGYGMRWIQDYDANYLRDRSVVSSFSGVSEIRDERNADGTWIIEEGEFDADELDVMGVDPTVQLDPTAGVVAAGTRKNVRVIKYNVTGTGTVMDNVTNP